MTYKILAIPNGNSGKPYYRIKLPLRSLNNLDPKVKVVVKHDGVYRLTQQELNHFDVLIMNGVGQHPLQIAQVLSTRNIKVIYDIDDLDFELPIDHDLYNYYKQKNVKDHIISTFNASDLITCTSKLIKKESEKLTDTPIKIIPNAIDYDYYYWNLDSNHKDINIGWVGGASHKHDLNLITGLGSWFIKNNKNTNFILGGWNSKVKPMQQPKKYSQTLNNYNMFYSEGERNIWVQYKNILFKGKYNKNKVKIIRSRPPHLYPQLFKDIDILLVPLKNDKYRNSKSLIKLIEASGYNIPIVASNVKPYKNIIKNGKNGFLAKNRKEWKQKVNKLINNKELRNKLGNNLRQTIEPKHNIHYQHKLYKEAITKLVRRRKHDN